VKLHTPEMGAWESTWALELLENDCKGQNTSHWRVLDIIGKLLKCRCLKWDQILPIWTSATQVMAKRKVKSQTSNLTLDH
jgi:hypothetical protein